MSARVLLRCCAIPLLAALGGCQSWQPVQVSPQVLVAERAPTELRVTLGTSERYVLQQPVASDSVIAGEFGFGRLSFPYSEVAVVEERRFSATRTVVSAGVAVLGFTIFKGWFSGSRVSQNPGG